MCRKVVTFNPFQLSNIGIFWTLKIEQFVGNLVVEVNIYIRLKKYTQCGCSDASCLWAI